MARRIATENGMGVYVRRALRSFWPPDRPPLLYWFLSLSTFLPYRQGVSPSFGTPELAGRYLEGDREINR